MTNAEIFDFMRGVILPMVPAGMPVVRAYNDAPAPTPQKTYIALEDDANWTVIGFRTDGNTDVSGLKRIVITDYEIKFIVWEIRGEGENLRNIVEHLQLFSVRNALSEVGLAILRTHPVLRVPSLHDKAFWNVNHRCEIVLGHSRAIEENVPSIQSVGILGEVTAGDEEVLVDIQVKYDEEPQTPGS